ncbi:MAG TPA: (Fe-S)-binding protein [Vicinamibacterales bacterium]|nr:(Fe-S)-binding protein [Vicinamibacterales bacterium]
MTRVVLFHTCLVNEIDPDVGLAVVRVLERLGFAIDVPLDQTCCGQPAFNAGFQDDARAVARHTLDVLDRTTDPIVVPSGSCADMLVHHYPHLFEREPAMHAKATRVAARCREFSQFVAECGVAMPTGTMATKVAYHPSCHLLRGLGVRDQPKQLIASVAGAEQVTVHEQEECCGFGGLFSVKNSEISSAMLGKKMTALEASGADRVVSCDLGCLLHIGGGLHRRGSTLRVQHLAQLLDESQS